MKTPAIEHGVWAKLAMDIMEDSSKECPCPDCGQMYLKKTQKDSNVTYACSCGVEFIMHKPINP